MITTWMDIAQEWTSNHTLCIFKNLTGIPCPGCGMTRAFLSVFELDFEKAFYYHPLFWIVPIFALLLLLQKRNQKAQQLLQNKYIVYGSLFMVLIVYAFRMFLYFPDTPPMDVQESALLFSIFH